MRVIICDDDKTFIQDLEERIRVISKIKKIELSFKTFTSAEEMFSYTMSILDDPELVFFLDIDMPEMSGFDVATRIKECNPGACIVFVSNKDELVYQSFRYGPLFFLRKNYLDDELAEQIERLEKLIHPQYTILTLPYEHQEIKVPIETVWYVESNRNYLMLHRSNDKPGYGLRVRMRISEAEVQWKKYGFIRIHKGFLVNVHYIDRLTKKGLRMMDGENIPVGGTYLTEVTKLLLGVDDAE